PQALLEQLKDGGRMVIPVGEGTQDMMVIEKVGGKIKQTKFPGFVFVPLVSPIRE
ncbi:MAG: protein-L-isoaspartate O-methyltransferase, partial [Patescibacteria group bacterium]